MERSRALQWGDGMWNHWHYRRRGRKVFVVAFPQHCCPLIDRGTMHVPHSSSPPSSFLSLSNHLSINPSFYSPSLHPHPPLLPLCPSSHLVPFLATIALSSHECQHPCDSTDQLVSEAHVCCVFDQHSVYPSRNPDKHIHYFLSLFLLISTSLCRFSLSCFVGYSLFFCVSLQ